MAIRSPTRAWALLASAVVHAGLVGAGAWIGFARHAGSERMPVELAVLPALLPPPAAPAPPLVTAKPPPATEPQVREALVDWEPEPAAPEPVAAWQPPQPAPRLGFRTLTATPEPIAAESTATMAVAPAPLPPPTGPTAPALASPQVGEFVSASPLTSACREPDYPRAARRRGLEGVVKLRVEVSAAGLPVAVQVEISSGHESLDRAAVEAVTLWRFEPARQDGIPVADVLLVPVRFTLLEPAR